jgi:hypothetical protein
MPAKATVPVDAQPQHPPLSRPWAAPTRHCLAADGTYSGGYTRGTPLVGTPRGHPAAGHRPERRAMPAKATIPVDAPPQHPPLSRPWAAPTRHCLAADGTYSGGYTRGTPLVGTPRGHPAAGHRPERRAMPAKATVPVDAQPQHPPLSRPWAAPTRRGCATACGSRPGSVGVVATDDPGPTPISSSSPARASPTRRARSSSCA